VVQLSLFAQIGIPLSGAKSEVLNSEGSPAWFLLCEQFLVLVLPVNFQLTNL